MSSYNRVIMMGNLTRNPELRYTPSNMAICSASLAVNEKRKDSKSGEWIEEVLFVDLTIFGKRGEAFEKFHKKGSAAFVEARLKLDTWEDKNSGQKRQKHFLVVDNWEFVGSSDERKRNGPEPRESFGGRKQQSSFAGDAAGGYSGGDDTPF